MVTCSFPRQNVHSIHVTINEELCKLSHWLCSNKIKINVEKTKYLIFSYRGGFNLNSISINHSNIECVKYVKYLGVHLDSNLRFDEHINRVSTKIAKTVGVLYKTSEIVPKYVLRMLYFALVYPYFNYCIPIWGNAAGVHLNKLVLLQKRAVRIVAKAPFLHHTDELFRELKILKLRDIFNFNIRIYMYKSLNVENYDDYLHTYVANNTTNHAYLVRNNLDIRVPRYRCELSKSCIDYTACRLWNEIPVNVRESSDSLGVFKNKLLLWHYL